MKTKRTLSLLLCLIMAFCFTVTGQAVEVSAQSKTYTQITSLSDITDGQYLLIAKFGTADTMPNDVMVKPEESPVTFDPGTGKNRKGLVITEFTGGDVSTISEDYSDYEWTFTKSGENWLLGDGTEFAYITADDIYKRPLTMEATGSLFSILEHDVKGFAFQNTDDRVFNYNADIVAISGYDSDPVGFYIYKLEAGSVVDPEEPDVSDDDEKTTVIACSDFQPENGNAAGKIVLQGLVNALIDAGITTADGFLCCGDYDYEYTETKQGVDAVKEVVNSIVNQNMVFSQGNHDSDIGTNGMSPSGNNDPASGEYGVFVINEDDYMWNNSDEATIKRTAQSVIEYMNEKIAAEYDKPIFVLSHLPLHYSMRTYYDGDGKHANYIFDALNAAGEKGLNIIYLFGHDHSNGWDDYLGGAAVYLKKGDKILIAQNSQTTFENETLNFTYMNAGYIGYYRNVNVGADTTLTMTVFDITDEAVSIARYDSQGLHNLKSAGVTNSYKGENSYSADTTVYTSPQTITLTAVTDTQPIPDLIEKPKPPAPPAASTEDQYIRITSAEFLKDGGQYLLVYNAALNPEVSIDNQIMLPEVKRVDRIGFNLEPTTAFGGDVVKGDYQSKLWTFTKSGNNWLFGDGEKYAAVTNTTDYKITATLEDNGNVFTIGGSADAFTFTSGSYVLNYNSRGLINGYESMPATFYIYEYVPGVEPTTETTVNKTEDGISGEVVLSNVPVGSTLIVAAYLGRQLVYAPQIITTTEDTTEDFAFASGVDTVKVFVWEDTASIAPLTIVEAVPVQ